MAASAAQTGGRPKRLEGPFAAKANIAERLPMLAATLERAGELCAEGLQQVAPEPPLMTLKGIESGSAHQIADAGNATVVAVLHAPRWDTHLLASLRQDAILAVVEMMLGGDGSEPADFGTRPLSKIEIGIARRFFTRIAKALEEAFAPVAATPFAVLPFDGELDMEPFEGANGAVAAARFQIDCCGRVGEIQVAIPQAALGPMRAVLSAVPKKEKKRPADPSWVQRIEQEVNRSKVVLSAILDERPMMLGEVMTLEVGQVLELAVTAESRVRVECNDERLMWCHLGKSNNVYTLRVDQYVDQEQEFMDDILPR